MAGDDDNKARNKILDEQYALDYGLISISTIGHGDKKLSLPKTSSFDPGDGKIEEKLGKVLQVKTLQNSMIKLLRPTITDRSIITPQQFRMKIKQVMDLFSSSEDINSAYALNRELFDEICELLASEEEKCELLDQYRHMLLMG
ncbi:MAG: hypothetical protein LBB15_00775 [Puniceicoccales bacterium]|jgi:hypothetical protein|nr:hypothetical protein [Puniceicoccales bacterium]